MSSRIKSPHPATTFTHAWLFFHVVQLPNTTVLNNHTFVIATVSESSTQPIRVVLLLLYEVQNKDDKGFQKTEKTWIHEKRMLTSQRNGGHQ